MTLVQAHEEVRELSSKSNSMTYFVVKDPYGDGYKVEFEPVELTIVKTQLKYQTGYNPNFNQKSQYGYTY